MIKFANKVFQDLQNVNLVNKQLLTRMGMIYVLCFSLICSWYIWDFYIFNCRPGTSSQEPVRDFERKTGGENEINNVSLEER